MIVILKISPHKINDLVRNTENLESLFIDTPDMYGREIAQIISSLALSKKLQFIALVLRSTKVDQIIKSPLFDPTIYTKEFNTYKLTDNEINKLLDLLEEKNLIGALKNKKREEQVNIFKSKNKYDRQLIVAMIEATSGKSFTEKICEEFESLDDDDRHIYCLVAVATEKSSSLSREEILIGIGEGRDNKTINIINKLIKRGLFIENDSRLKVRHRVIAEKIYDRLSSDKRLMIYYQRLVYIVAVSIGLSPEQKRMKRLLKKLINHETLFKISGIPEAQKLYESVADSLKNNHHFWLQRGCFELEHGKLNIARNYLNQSSSLNNSDPLVKLSLAHLYFKEAIVNSNTEQAHQLAEGAYDDIVQLIDERGKLDPYPYHVLGAQGLRWAKKGIKSIEKRREYLENLWDIMKKGVKNHPRSDKLINIRDTIKKEVLDFSLRN